jgi:hypothetical protein
MQVTQQEAQALAASFTGYSTDPVRDAERHMALRDKLDAQRQAAQQTYREEIAAIFKGMRTHPVCWLTLPSIGIDDQLERMPLQDAITDSLTFGKPVEVLMRVLQLSDCPHVEALRLAIEKDYTERNVDLLAELTN